LYNLDLRTLAWGKFLKLRLTRRLWSN